MTRASQRISNDDMGQPGQDALFVADDPFFGHVRTPTGQEMHLADILPDGVIGTNGAGIIAFVNREAERIVGMGREELLGSRIADLDVTERDGQPWWTAVEEASAHRNVSGHRERMVNIGDRHVLLTLRVVRMAEGAPVGAFMVGLRSAEARLRAEADHAALISTVAHELRSPLGGHPRLCRDAHPSVG